MAKLRIRQTLLPQFKRKQQIFEAAAAADDIANRALFGDAPEFVVVGIAQGHSGEQQAENQVEQPTEAAGQNRAVIVESSF